MSPLLALPYLRLALKNEPENQDALKSMANLYGMVNRYDMSHVYLIEIALANEKYDEAKRLLKNLRQIVKKNKSVDGADFIDGKIADFEAILKGK